VHDTADRDAAASGWWQVVLSGIDAVALHPVQNAVTAACLVAMLTPYIAGVAIARGLIDASQDAIASGADLYVHAERFGTSVPIPRALQTAVATIEGVTRVVPRIVSPIVLGVRHEDALLVGVPADQLPFTPDVVRGRVFSPGESHEVVLGEALADALDLNVGSQIPPFYRSARGERVATVVGIFRDSSSPWLGRMVFTSLATAARIANEDDAVSQLLVECDEGRARQVAGAIERHPLNGLVAAEPGLRLQVTTRDDLELLLPRTLYHREAGLHLLFALVFGLGVPVVLVTSGLGHRGRRRETGLLRATGWRIDEVVVRVLVENTTVAVAGASAAVLFAWSWLELGGGVGAAPIFLRGDASLIAGGVPYRMTPIPVLLAVTFALAIVLAGSVAATWRTASAPPSRAMA